MRQAVLLTALVAVLGVGAEAARADDGVAMAGRSTADGVYTEAQAESGEALFEQHCLVCHDKKYFRPVLKRWSGQPVATFYDVMTGSMPESNPGGLMDHEYVDILAYIFSRSRFPAGDADLEAGGDVLAGITIQ